MGTTGGGTPGITVTMQNDSASPVRTWLERTQSFLRTVRVRSLSAQMRLVLSERQRVFALTIGLGAVCGLAAVAFHVTIRLLGHLFIERAMAAQGHAWIGWTIVTPAAGGLAAGALLSYLVPNAAGSGVPQVKAAYASLSGRIRLRDSVGKFLISSFQIGTGASLGREGPTVHICSGLASALGRFFGISQNNLRRLLPVGAAAGIAAAFNAPIAAVTFTIEEVVGHLDGTVLSGVIIAAALSAAVERSVLGEEPVFQVPQGHVLHDAQSLLVCAALGVVAAGVSIAFTESLLGIRSRSKRIERIPRWIHPAVGGTVTGALAVVAFLLFRIDGVTGGGYATLGSALAGKLAFKTLVVLCVFKLIATVASYGTGGAGGIFAPALFIGGMLGGAAGFVDRMLFQHSVESLGAFALVGMGAVFSGIIRAPVTSVLIIIEMTGGYGLILPLMIANMSAYVIARHFRPVPIYEALLAQDGIHIRRENMGDALKHVALGEIASLGRHVVSFSPAMGAGDLVQRSALPANQSVFPVLDDQNKLVGIITVDDLVILASEPDLAPLVHAVDIMHPAVSVRAQDDLLKAVETMEANGLHEIPISDEAGRVVGMLKEAEVAHACMVHLQLAGSAN
jgi:CIC family chloride channel protein